MRANELACHLPMVLQKVDRAAMHHSLEVRVPLLDLELVDLAARVDPSRRARTGRPASWCCATPSSATCPATGSRCPSGASPCRCGQWLADDLRPAVEELLLDRDPFPSGFFDRDGLAGLLRATTAAGRLDLTRGLWNLLALQLWADRHLRPLDVA